jgi:hypothetical protein
MMSDSRLNSRISVPIFKTGFTLRPYPSAISGLLQDLKRTMPKAKTAKPEEFIDNRLLRELD